MDYASISEGEIDEA